MGVADFDSKRARSLGRALHDGYHIGLISGEKAVPCHISGRELKIAASTMAWAIEIARAWCRNFDAHGTILIRARLPWPWAFSPKRRAFALRVFEELCEGSLSHEYGRLPILATELGSSISTIELHRLDFFVFVAACALDDETWGLAMKEVGDEG